MVVLDFVYRYTSGFTTTEHLKTLQIKNDEKHTGLFIFLVGIMDGEMLVLTDVLSGLVKVYLGQIFYSIHEYREL